MVKIADKAVLITGGNRGIGRALVEEALSRGAKRVYAGTREPLADPDGRVTPLTLEVTKATQIRETVERVDSLDVLINNAGIAFYGDLSDRSALERHLAVNLFGTYAAGRSLGRTRRRAGRGTGVTPSGWTAARPRSGHGSRRDATTI
jgi:NAD(P)-dependent dehydrogenase (short-subunit alcohol dehydrogenase family)